VRRRHIALMKARRRFRGSAYTSWLNLHILMGIIMPKLRANVSRFMGSALRSIKRKRRATRVDISLGRRLAMRSRTRFDDTLLARHPINDESITDITLQRRSICRER
jgi:hypothetical protein